MSNCNRFSLVLGLLAASNALLGQVQVREDRLTLTTYENGPLSPNPEFPQFHDNEYPNYPYPILRNKSKAARQTTSRVVILENEYLSCRILPDLRGILYGCTDKVTKKEIFHVPTGVAFGFPVTRTEVATAPVDSTWSLEDGVGRVEVEDTDRVSGMGWRVEYILQPRSAVLEQRVTLHNTSMGRRSYHWWASAAVDLDSPGVGLFPQAAHEPWMAIYKPASKTGLIHYADPAQVPGKFLFENAPEKVLEMRAGVMEGQHDYAFLQPGEVKMFNHYWIPFREMDGVTRATRDVVLDIRRTGGAVTIELLATHSLAGAKIRVLDGTKPVLETAADLDPKTVWTKAVDNAPASVTVDVLNAAGAVVLHAGEGVIDAAPNARTAEPVEPPAPTTEASYLAHGLWYELHDQVLLAWLDYRSGLAKFRTSERLALAAGRVAFILNRHDDALRLLAPISHGPLQTEAAYYYGASLAAGSPLHFEVQNALNNAARDPAFSTAARTQLAMLSARDGDLAGAAKIIAVATTEPLEGTALDPRASAEMGALEVAILRRAGQADAAKKRLDFWLQRAPADNMLRVERTLLGGADDATLWAHLGSDPERVLRIADEYADINAWQDALSVLDRKYPQDYALMAYYRGYCRLKLGQDPAADFKAGAALSTLDVFPNRTREFDVLEAAIAKDGNDANAHSLLGDLWFLSGETDQAIAEWRKALALKKDIPALHRNLGRALLEIKRDPGAARTVFQEGLRLFPQDDELPGLIEKASGSAPITSKYFEVPLPKNEVKPEAPRAAPKETAPGPPPPAVSALPASGDAATNALLGSAMEADRAFALFTAANFPKDKQPNEVRRAYIEVKLQRLLLRAHGGKCRDAISGIETLGDEDPNLPFTLYGFGAFTKAPHFEYYLGVIQNVCGDEKAAKKQWSRLGKATESFDSVEDVFPYLAMQELNESGWQQKIGAAIKTVQAKEASNPKPELEFIEGALLSAAGKREEANPLLQKAIHSTDVMSQYLSLVTVRENSAK